MSSKYLAPLTMISLAASLFIPYSGVIHAPPATNPLDIFISKLKPNRCASSAEKRSISHHSSENPGDAFSALPCDWS